MVRTRIAPSPTGYMHIGNLRTALYAYCIARHVGGKFLLRIEDTDRKRNVPKAIQVIYDSLRLAGLEYDEGPDVGGDFGPYVQSERKATGLYQHYANELVELGGAYPCFCQQGDAAVKTTARSRRDPCRFLTEAEINKRLAAGQKPVIRQRIPEEGSTTFVDSVFGSITVKNSTLDDQILLKSDGYPTYNFANVVDDHLMEITHVVRGVEYLSSTPKYNLLYQSFGWEIPQYIHLPLIVKPNGKKLSKREGDASFQDLMAKGFLPEAIVNCIALLGWNPGDNREFFSLPDLVREFEIHRINKSKAAFAIEKLEWLNGEYIRKMSAEDFYQRAEKFFPASFSKKFDTRLVSQVIQPRLTKLADIPHITQFLQELPDYDSELFLNSKSKSTAESCIQVLKAAAPLLADLADWREETIRAALLALGEQAQMKTGTLMWPVRIALSGQTVTPGGATEIAAILGKKETLKRLKKGLSLLEARPS